MMKDCLFIALALLIFGCGSKKESKSESNTSLIDYTIVKVFPHDAKAFTQGLVVEQGNLLESTGQNGTSWIAEVDIVTGKQEKKVELDKQYFGEGITVLNNKIYQLTWKSKVGFIYSINYEKIGEFNYDREGWGITHNSENLIASDGTEKLYFLDTLTLAVKKTITVSEKGKAINNLNELEYIDGFIYANVWQTNFIVKINPANGEVVGTLDLTQVAEVVYPGNPNADVLNGIAYEPKSKLVLVTGKLWPALVAIRLK
ncbi:MAG: glutaminyl-peptide cyclotransferase [Chryseotalea sp. WA131a]|nr:MAG: glutaminyl-peptide cyclotransferase [Chryseotalea sp. WA131a]